MMSDKRSSKDHEIGSSDGIVDMLRHHGITVTREHYLNLAYMGEPPEELSAEQEANLPTILRK